MKKLNFKNFGGGLKKYRFLSEIFFVSATLSLIGVGFGSFQILDDNNLSFDISTGVGEITSGSIFKEYQDSKCFSICKDGFIDNGIIYDEGELIYYLSIDSVNATHEGYVNNNVINIKTTLTSLNNRNIINSSYLDEVILVSTSGTSTLSNNLFNLNSLSNTFSLTLNENQSTHNFNIIYKFNSGLYNVLSSSPLFNLNIKAINEG